MFKKNKIQNLKMKIISVVVLVAMLSVQLEPLTNMMAAAGSLNYNSGKKINPIYDPYYQYSSGIYEDTLGGSYAYCLDYGRELPTGVLSFEKYSSPQATAVMIYGYPNVSATTLGVNNGTEANLTTKLAMWIVSQATGENTKSIMDFDINRLQATAGYESITPRCIAAAKVLANKALNNPYTAKPTIQITSTGARLSHIGNQIVAGPYKVAVTGSSSTKTANISLANAPASAITTDSAGNKKTAFGLGEEIFVKMSDKESTGELSIKAQADGEKILGGTYGNTLYYTQHFTVLIREPISLITNLKLNWNGLQGNVEILKVDQNNNKVKGVTFELRDLSGKTLKTVVTGDDGYARFSNVGVGEYRIVEVAAPAGYVMGKDPINVIVKAGETFKATHVNQKSNGGLKIVKTTNENKPLAGVKFQILNSAKRVLETITTDSNGVALLNDLPNGTYYYKEVSAPDYVIIDSTIYEFKVEGNLVTKNIVNEVVKGNLKIVKTNSDKQPLAGVKFQIMDSTKKVIETITTDASGIATSGSLVKGTYYYKEVEAPSNVIMDPKTYEFKITKMNEVVTKNVENKLVKGSLKIIKVDENEKPLEGVKFQILDSNSKLIEVITTDANGVAVSKELAKGNYFYKEISAPAGIIIDSNKYPFTVSGDNDLVIKNIVNKLIKGKLEILKVDGDNKPLEGVKFDILNDKKEVIQTLTTDATGKASTKDLVYGTYYYKEVSAPSHVVMDSNTYEFKITTTNQIVAKTIVNKFISGKFKIIKVDENEKPLEGVKFNILDSNSKVIQTITTNKEGIAESKDIEYGTYYYQEISAPAGIVIDNTKYKFVISKESNPVVIKMINKYVKGKLEIVKIDDSKTPIAGVKFDILNDKKEVIQTITTDGEGKTVTKDLVYGKYYYKEVSAPENVVMDPKIYEFSITENNQIISKTIENKLLRGALKIIKVDENQKPLAGVKFQILDANSKVIDTIITDVNGIAASKELEKGKYYYKEISAPDGIVIDDNKYEFVVANDNDVVIKNIVNKFSRGKLEILKVDDSKAPIEGVKFDIMNEQKQVIQTIISDINGKAISQDLIYGKYYFKEVSAPENVVMDTATYEFNIRDNNQVVYKTIVNSKLTGGLRILKLDKETKSPIAGVRFEILNEKKEVVATVITDENGIAKKDGLLKGKYYYKEIKAPDKYIIDSKEYEFDIQKSGQIIEKTVYNELKKLPVTGGFIGNDTMIIIMISIITIFGYIVSKYIFAIKPKNIRKLLNSSNDLIV